MIKYNSLSSACNETSCNKNGPISFLHPPCDLQYSNSTFKASFLHLSHSYPSHYFPLITHSFILIFSFSLIPLIPLIPLIRSSVSSFSSSHPSHLFHPSHPLICLILLIPLILLISLFSYPSPPSIWSTVAPLSKLLTPFTPLSFSLFPSHHPFFHSHL